MPKVQSITYSLESPREVYKPGDTVSGYWTLDLGESFSVRGIRTALIGAAFTRWTAQDPRKDDKISHEKIITQWRTVFGKKRKLKTTSLYNILKDIRNAPPAKMLIYCQNVLI